MDMQRVLVTGSDGMVGRAIVKDLNECGYPVTRVDKYPGQRWGTKCVDCEDLGQVISVMKGHRAVIHMAAIPSPGSHPVEVVFRNNVISTFNILEAAAILGINNVVLASSISALGTSFHLRHFNPLRVPVDESHPLLSQDAYGLSKMVGEELAEGYCRRLPELSLSSLRFSYVVAERNREYLLQTLSDPAHDHREFAGVLWTYVDVRDVAVSCRLAMEKALPGHEAYYINAPNIMLDTPIEALLAECYPGDYPVADHIRGNASPVDCSKAERMLGWKAVYNWDGQKL
jgi:UDP-glucose 4-epimerase